MSSTFLSHKYIPCRVYNIPCSCEGVYVGEQIVQSNIQNVFSRTFSQNLRFAKQHLKLILFDGTYIVVQSQLNLQSKSYQAHKNINREINTHHGSLALIGYYDQPDTNQLSLQT